MRGQKLPVWTLQSAKGMNRDTLSGRKPGHTDSEQKEERSQMV